MSERQVWENDSMYRLIDTHAHLEEMESLEQVLDAARSVGIIAVIGVGTGGDSNKKVLEFAQVYKDFVYPALGLHPWNLKASEIDQNLEFIEANIDEAVAIGEVGLDYHKRVRAKAEKDLQKYALSELLKIASSITN